MSIADDIYPVRAAKPRSFGLTMVLDTLQGLNQSEFRVLTEYVDIVNIGWGLPLLVNRAILAERIRFYHDLGIKVLADGFLLEMAVARKIVPKIIQLVRQVGFDMVKISESSGDFSISQKQELVDLATHHGLEHFIEVGKKDHKKQLTLSDTIARIRDAFQLRSKKVILEGGEDGRGVGMYDEDGRINWNWLNEVVGTFGPPNLIFEAPLSSQQVALIQEFGPDVNLGDISLNGIAKLESQRRGLLGESFGIARPREPVLSSPAAKFIYHLINEESSIDQSQLVERSGLPKRTVQVALDYLKREGFVKEVVDLSDSRRRRYSLIAR